MAPQVLLSAVDLTNPMPRWADKLSYSQPEDSLDSYSTNMPSWRSHRHPHKKRFPERSQSSRQSWVQLQGVGTHTQLLTVRYTTMVLCVYTRPGNFLLLSITVPAIMSRPPPQSLTMIINNYSRFSSESVQIRLLPILLDSQYEILTATEISPYFNICMNCFIV